MQTTNAGPTVAAPAHARAVLVSARHGRRVDVERLATIILFVLPAAVVYSVFVLLPVVQAVYYSFFQWNGLGAPTDFVGLDNISRVFSDTAFLSALAHNIIILVLSIAL